MGCCMGKKVLKILAGLALITVSLNMFVITKDQWLIVGAYLLLAGILPFVCPCECCGGACKKK